MTTVNPSGKSTRRKPLKSTGKPYAEFPLTRHPSGRWCKKIRGRSYYFGPIDDPQRALEKYLSQVDRIQAGLPPVADPTAPTVALLVESFLVEKQRAVECGELTPQSLSEHRRDAVRVLESLGKFRLLSELRPDDFSRLRVALHRGVGVVTAANRINRVRSLLKFAFDSGLSDTPLRYGVTLKRPARRSMRIARAEKGLRMLEAWEIRLALAGASPRMRAAILLGTNAGLGNRDVATLELRHLDLGAGWLKFARRKTGIMRRCRLWPETIAAVDAVIKSRPTPKNPADSNLVFLSAWGSPMVRDTVGKSGNLSRVDLVSQGFTELMKRQGIERRGSFYLLRHTLQTIGEELGDLVAVRSLMGHADNAGDMSATYRARVDDERLQRVVDHVRRWLFPPKVKSRR